jgi:hypothetical protein
MSSEVQTAGISACSQYYTQMEKGERERERYRVGGLAVLERELEAVPANAHDSSAVSAQLVAATVHGERHQQFHVLEHEVSRKQEGHRTERQIIQTARMGERLGTSFGTSNFFVLSAL